MSSSADKVFHYSTKYYDDEYEYRHVHCPKDTAKLIPKNRLLCEYEWRALGVQQSVGWIHYMIHTPERHVLLFRRLRTDNPNARSSTTTTTNNNRSSNMAAVGNG